MAAASETKLINLKVSNFGPIADASIELRPMSVFVGPSNSGKSYLAVLIYALQQFFSAYAWTSRDRRIRGSLRSHRLPFITPMSEMALSATDIDHLYEWAATERMRIESASSSGASPPNSDLPAEVSDIVRRALGQVGSLSDVLREEILRCFGFETSENLVLYSPNDIKASRMRAVVSNELAGGDAYSYEIGVAKEETTIDPKIPEIVPFAISENLPFPWFSLSSDDVGYQRENNARAHLAVFASAALSLSVGPLGRPAHYLPADRAGVMHAHQVAVRGLIAGASRMAIRSAPTMPVLSGVLGDFLEQLIELGSVPVSREYHADDGLAHLLETGLMRGSVRVERSEIDYPSFVYRPNSWQRDLPLMHSSSMVSELAPVVLYLRHVVRPGDTLIIEEPEAHLHPTAQVEFTRLLAAAVKAGIRVILTTHSEWVLWELANLVRMSVVPPELRNGLDGAEHALEAAEVGAWLFEPHVERGGSVVKEMPLDIESGTFPAGFSLTAESLYKRWSTINRRIRKSNAIHDSKDYKVEDQLALPN